MKKVLFIGLLASLVSCATSIASVPLQRRVYNEPPQNEIVTKEIGDKLLVQGEEDYQEAVKILSVSNNIRIYNTAFPYSPGTVLPLSGNIENFKLYFDAKSKQERAYNGGTSEIYFGVAIRKSDDKAFLFYNQIAGTLGGLEIKTDEVLTTEKTTYTDPNCKNCFKQEFVFNGKVDNNLKFIYREYSENMARPAFTQELQYDLKESNIIGFKGVRLEILKATNTVIEYKILSSFIK